MTRRCGIDASILARLATAHPEADFAACVRSLSALIEGGCELFASSQVLGEAYTALQHHYGVSKVDARSALRQIFRSGVVAPSNGAVAIKMLEASGGAGLLDRLTVNDYVRSGLKVPTLDRKMARLVDAGRL